MSTNEHKGTSAGGNSADGGISTAIIIVIVVASLVLGVLTAVALLYMMRSGTPEGSVEVGDSTCVGLSSDMEKSERPFGRDCSANIFSGCQSGPVSNA